MKVLKSIARMLTLSIPGKIRRKNARLKVEDFLNALCKTEKYRCGRRFEQEVSVNKSLPREQFHIISLGTNCFVRMTLNLWGLKPRKADGELSMPFDLSVHPLPVVVKLLETHFEGYFKHIEFDEKNGYWINSELGIKFIHEKENNREAFIERYRKRIENFYAALQDDKPCLLVCHDMRSVDGQQINALWAAVQKLCPHKKIKLIAAVFNGTVGNCNENINIYTNEFPYKGYLYMDKMVKFTKAGYAFEEPFVRLCREEVLNLLGD